MLVIDQRDHIAGNAYDYVDEHGVLVHHYGPHIFHTNSDKVVDYLSRFTEWRPYEHRVLAASTASCVPMPDQPHHRQRALRARAETEEEVEAFYAERRRAASTPSGPARTPWSRKVGRDLYEKFFRGYTLKQWSATRRELHASGHARASRSAPTPTTATSPTRSRRCRADGYTAMFKRMLDHPNIELRLGVDYFDVREDLRCDHVVFTGPIDGFFDHRFGELPYRSLEFVMRNEATPGGGLLQPSRPSTTRAPTFRTRARPSSGT